MLCWWCGKARRGGYPFIPIGKHCLVVIVICTYRVNCKLGLLDGDEGSGREGRVWYFDLCIDHLYFTIQATEKFSAAMY